MSQPPPPPPNHHHEQQFQQQQQHQLQLTTPLPETPMGYVLTNDDNDTNKNNDDDDDIRSQNTFMREYYHHQQYNNRSSRAILSMFSSSSSILGITERIDNRTSTKNNPTPYAATGKSSFDHFRACTAGIYDDENSNASAISPTNNYPSWQEQQGRRSTFFVAVETIVNHWRFKLWMVILIVINSITMGIATFAFVRQNPTIQHCFDALDMIFLIIFTIELLLHFCHRGFSLFRNYGLVFDFFIVVTSWFFRTFKVFRAFRIIRAFRLIIKIDELKELVWALVSVVPRLFAIGLLMTLVFYVFAVMFTTLFRDLYEEGYTPDQDYFSRLDLSSFTLFQIMTLDGWSNLTKQMMQKYWWAWIPMIVFIIISTFIVINLIIAVICDAVSTIQKKQLTRQFDDIRRQASDVSDLHRTDYERLEAKLEAITQLVHWLAEQEEEAEEEDNQTRTSSLSLSPSLSLQSQQQRRKQA